MQPITDLMMALLRSEIIGNELDKTLFDGMSEDDWARLYRLAKSHDLAHLVGDAVIKNELLSEGENKLAFEKHIMTVVYRYQQLQYELGELKRVLNNSQISFIPLKGAVLRRYYPEPWMRNSCDIDILVHENDLSKAQTAIESQLHYNFEKKGDHDIGAIAPSGVHLELHYRLNEVNVKRKSDIPLQRAWNYATAEGDFCCAFSDEMFYFYHIMHMAKHFENGGCGIRPFIDLWILNRKLKCDPIKKAELLDEGGLATFSKEANLLSEVLLEGREPSPVSAQMLDYILSGGVYGTKNNKMAVYQNKKNGKLGYLFYRLWSPYPYLCVLYPSLEGKRILQPFYEIRRWFRLLRKDTFNRSRTEFKTSMSISDEQTKKTSKMLEDLGLIAK